MPHKEKLTGKARPAPLPGAVSAMTCRRRASWSTATFVDSLIYSFLVPFGPLVLLSTSSLARPGIKLGNFDALQEHDRNNPNESLEQWRLVAQCWTQIVAAFLVGRTAGKLLGPLASKARPSVASVLTASCFALSLATQLGLGLHTRRAMSSTMDPACMMWMWLRCLGGLLCGVGCSGALAVQGAPARSSGCRQCDLRSGSRNSSEVRVHRGSKLGDDDDEGNYVSLRRADFWCNVGLVSGPLVGGLCYERTAGWRWLDQGDNPALAACVSMCFCALGVASLRSDRFRRMAHCAFRRCRSFSVCRGGRGAERRFVTRSGTETASHRRAVSRSRRMSGADFSRRAPSGIRTVNDEDTFALMSAVPGGDHATEAAPSPDGDDLEAGEMRHESVPGRYIKARGGDVLAARKMWDASIKWRADTGAEHSLSSPQPTLEIIKECYPYYLHGRSRRGECVVYELTGRMQLGRLAKAGVTPFDLQMHYAFFNDFVFGKLLPAADAQLMTVLDVGGLRLSTLKGNTVVLKYLAATSEIMQNHYPERQSRILVVNAPWWFAAVWKPISDMLSGGGEGGAHAKVRIMGADFLPALLEYVDMTEIPPEYGGRSPNKLGNSVDEVALREFAAGLGPTSLPSAIALNAPSGASSVATEGASSITRDAKQNSVAGRGPENLGRAPGTSPAVGEHNSNVGRLIGAGGGGSALGVGGSQGMTQRLASAMRRMRGGSATRAHLGLENKFRYDTERGMWIMDGDDGESGGNGRRGPEREGGGLRRELGEEGYDAERERSLILAIQAAQQARGGRSLRDGNFSDRAVATWRMDGPPLPGSHNGFSSAAAVIFSLHTALAASEAAVEALLPLWLLAPVALGGMALSAAEAGAVLSAAAGITLVFSHWMAPTMGLPGATARSPVRTLRAAAAAQILAAFVLSSLGNPTSTPLIPRRGAALSAVAAAIATIRAASVLARPCFANLLSIALGYAEGTSTSRRRGVARTRWGGRRWRATVGGISRTVGVLLAGSIFAATVRARAAAGVVCFRLVGLVFVGIFLATLFVDATEGTGGGGRCEPRGGTGGPWLVTCDFIEEAMPSGNRSRPSRRDERSVRPSDGSAIDVSKES